MDPQQLPAFAFGLGGGGGGGEASERARVAKMVPRCTLGQIQHECVSLTPRMFSNTCVQGQKFFRQGQNNFRQGQNNFRQAQNNFRQGPK